MSGSRVPDHRPSGAALRQIRALLDRLDPEQHWGGLRKVLTPEGHYLIDRRNPQSDFHLSLGIDYPRPHDIAEAEALGQKPGGDIFIHGQGRPADARGRDWTWGCIAVTNPEMEEVYSMVRTGTYVSIYP